MREDKNIPRIRFPEFENEWGERSVGDCYEIVGGGTPSTTNEEYWDGEINWFTPTEIKQRTVNNSIRKISSDGLKYSSAKLLPIDTLLFTSRATIGEMSFTQVECTTNQGFQSILPSDSNDNRFFYYWALLNNKTFVRKSSGSTFLEISKKVIEKITFNIPSLSEQQKISDFLTSVDKRIELLEKKKTLLETYKKDVMKKIFNQEIRFKDDDGNHFPEWELKKMKDFSSCFSGGTPTSTIKRYYNGHIPFIKSGEIGSSTTKQFLTEEGLNNSSSKRVIKGDLLIALYGATSGEVAISKIDGTINQAVLCIRGDFNTYFLYSYLLRKKKKIVSTYLQGGQGNLSSEIIKKLKIDLPSMPEQKKISEFLSRIDKQIYVLSSQIDNFKTWKKGLLQKMFI